MVSQAGEKVSFRYPDNPSFDLVYLADQLGYFDDTNTRPKYIGKVAASQIIPLTGTGEIDFGSRMVPLVISAVASGADIKVVAAGNRTLQDAPHMKYFVRKDSGIRAPKDLDVNRINFVVIPDDQAEQTLATGNTDLAIIRLRHRCSRACGCSSSVAAPPRSTTRAWTAFGAMRAHIRCTIRCAGSTTP